MVDPNRQLSDQIYVMLGITGVLNGATPVDSACVDAKAPRKILAVFALGDVAAGITCSIIKASDTSGTGAVVIKTATILAAHATNNDQAQVLINLDQAELDTAKPFLGLRIVADGAETGRYSAVLYGAFARETPLSSLDHAKVLQIVV